LGIWAKDACAYFVWPLQLMAENQEYESAIEEMAEVNTQCQAELDELTVQP
jgi:hypothetical protein